MGYEASAWCRLEQERTYLIYQKHNQDIAYQKNRIIIDDYNSDYDVNQEEYLLSENGIASYGDHAEPWSDVEYTLEDDSVLTHLTQKEEHD